MPDTIPPSPPVLSPPPPASPPPVTSPPAITVARAQVQEAGTADTEDVNDDGPPATLGEKVGLVAFLLVGCLLAFRLGVAAITECEGMLRPESSASWIKPKDVTLKNGPPQFRYDVKSEKLIYQGPIDEAQKRTLKELFQTQTAAITNTSEPQPNPTLNGTSGNPGTATPPPPINPTPPPINGGGTAQSSTSGTGVASAPPPVSGAGTISPTAIAAVTAPPPATGASTPPPPANSAGAIRAGTTATTNTSSSNTDARQVYEGAIDELAFSASSKGAIPMLLVLKLGILGGIFGALLRSLNDFVGTVCYKGNFSLQKYWPLHVTRPFVGAILGCFTIILFNAGFLTTTGTPPASSAWWSIAVAFLAGFSTLDVTERLRSTAKALFGSAPPEGSRSGTNQNTTVINQGTASITAAASTRGAGR